MTDQTTPGPDPDAEAAEPPPAPPDRDNGNHYPLAFRLEAVEAVRSGRFGTRPQTAEALGVNYQTLSNWVRELGEDAMLAKARDEYEKALEDKDNDPGAFDGDDESTDDAPAAPRPKARTSSPLPPAPPEARTPPRATGAPTPKAPKPGVVPSQPAAAAAPKPKRRKPGRQGTPDATRIDAVARVLSTGKSQSEVAKEMGLNVKTLGGWVVKARKGDQFTKDPLPPGALQAPPQAKPPAVVDPPEPAESPATMVAEIRATDLTQPEAEALLAEWEELRKANKRQRKKLAKLKADRKRLEADRKRLEAENATLTEAVRLFANRGNGA